MASVYKRKCDRHRKNAPYYVAFNDHEGKRRTRKGFTDRGLTEQLGARLEHEVMLRRRGLIDPVQEKLASQKKLPVEEHLAAFEKGLAHATPKHVKLTMTRVRRVVEGCGFASIGDIEGEAVQEYLVALRAEEDLGARTYNHYLQAFGEFCKWLASTGRLGASPVAGLDVLNAETDVRHKRRALAPEEVERLMASARASGEVIQGYDGETRARIYLFSYLTGLRRQEMGSLTPRSFDLAADRPTVTVEAACSKHRRKDVLPLHPVLVELLPAWMDGLKPDDPLFPKIARRKTWLLVKKDLERIGIPYETADGVADFHASGRHSYVTGLLRSGASITEARELARHSDVRMTMRYTHIGLEDRARALAALPAPGAGQQRFSSAPGVSGCHQSAPADTIELGDGRPANDETPSREGVSSAVVSACQEEAIDVSNGGGGNCRSRPKVATRCKIGDCVGTIRSLQRIGSASVGLIVSG